MVVDRSGRQLQIAAAAQWRSVLLKHGLSPFELETACHLLDRLEASRPSLLDAIQAEHLQRRRNLIECFRGRDSLPSDPGWRNLGSVRLLICEMMNNLEQDFETLVKIETLPTYERESAVERAERSIDPGRVRFPYFSPLHKRSFDFRLDALIRTHLVLMRTATAIAWYEAEQGRYPNSLSDLVPRYLAQVVACPLSGKPFSYDHGKLCASGVGWEANGGEDVNWTISRK